MNQNSETTEESVDQTAQPEPATKGVGYARPPQSTRFPKGQSGNPKGRPKGSFNFVTMLMATLREKVVINENGQRRSVTKFEAALKQLVNKAASGHLGAILQLVALAREAEERENLPGKQDPGLNEVDQKVLQGILSRFQISTEAQEAENDEADRG